MQYLLDTHTFIWFIEDDKMLSPKAAKEIIEINNDCYLSIASLWEIAIKINIGKLILKVPFKDLISLIIENNIQILSIDFEHLQKLMTLELIHRDPFDRIIIAQAIVHNFTIIGNDKNFKYYPIKCIC